MNRDDAIKDDAIKMIEGLYPTDSEFTSTNEIGEQLLRQAREELNIITDWRDEPTEVLIRYAELCQQKEEEQTRALFRRNR